MELVPSLDVLIAVLNFMVAGYLVVRVRRLAGHFTLAPIALGAFFVLRGLSRLTDPRGFEIATFDDAWLVIELLLVVALLAVLTTLESVVRGMAARDDLARFRAEEYDRARRHYTQVVRHRLMNPLTTIKGGAQTLRVDGAVDPVTYTRIIDAIIDAAEELEEVSLEPERRDELEHDLDAIPRVDDRRRSSSFADRAPGPR